MQQQDDLDSLDSLYKEAKKHILAKRAEVKADLPKGVVRVKEAMPDVVNPSAIYTTPSNWIRSRNIALIHTETRSLLGNFVEWVHQSIPGCRRLIRDKNLLSIDAVEEVSGNWTYEGAPCELPEKSDAYRDITSFVALEEPAVSCVVEVRVYYFWSGIARVEVLEDTSFSAAGQILIIPAGTNVFPTMTRESKIALKKELDAE